MISSLRSSHGINGYCQNLLIGPLQRVEAVGVWIARLTPAAELQFTGESNALGITLVGHKAPLLGQTPVSIAVRTRKLYSTNKIPDEWLNDQKMPPGLVFTAFPIQHDLLVRGAMMIGHSNSENSKQLIGDMYEILEAITELTFDFAQLGTRKNGESLFGINHELTARQRIILALISEGFTNYQIARKLNVSESTVKHETIRIYRFLEVSNRQDAIEAAKQQGLLATSPEAVTGT